MVLLPQFYRTNPRLVTGCMLVALFVYRYRATAVNRLG